MYSIDRRSDELPFELARLAAELASLLDSLGAPYLLKFSGSRGFHFLRGFEAAERRALVGGDVRSFERRIIRYLRQELEDRLQRHPRRAEFCTGTATAVCHVVRIFLSIHVYGGRILRGRGAAIAPVLTRTRTIFATGAPSQ